MNREILVMEDEPDIRSLVVLHLEREGFRCPGARPHAAGARHDERRADIPRAIRLILVARFLKRVADHATNATGMVVDLVESKAVRHVLA